MFRAMITLSVPVSATDADNIVDLISDWIKSNPSVTVDKVILEIDPDRPAMLESVTADDCASETPPPRQSSPSSSSSSLPVGIIIGIVVAAVIVLLFIMIIVGIVIYRRRKSSYRYYNYAIKK